ncbi:alpha/beta fold hydrolase [Paraburkholderia rhizosphaerae]|uniref:Alpha/beta hydrolase family protein n=1 Tax=Paraburkholderia rhizosphaerae TaxID=480658 RepID=A0A4R8L7X6_9BURK|nr:alpha/beta fold hydrolase [Paraburkholderia rhizosphaerae]TDY38813.1 alpha/beta hydrolase family protein [Paraburkholderia rhizosphaerae]
MSSEASSSHTPSGPDRSHTFVLIHGAWHGGWCWRYVANALRAQGHQVFTPTLTGHGERRHLLSAATSVDVPITDIVNLLEAEELADVVLVGHSYGGLVAAGVADRRPDVLRSLVFLDSLLVESGQAALDILPRDLVEARLKAIAASGQPLLMPVPSVAAMGIPDDHPRADWVRRRLTPHPLATYNTPLVLRYPLGNGLPRTYVHCAQPSYEVLAPVRERIRALPGWHWEELASGHDAMVLDPELLADLLVRLATRDA